MHPPRSPQPVHEKQLNDLSIPCISDLRFGNVAFPFYRIAENTTEIHRLRPPRRFYKDQIMRPYNVLEAAGSAILVVIKVCLCFQNS